MDEPCVSVESKSVCIDKLVRDDCEQGLGSFYSLQLRSPDSNEGMTDQEEDEAAPKEKHEPYPPDFCTVLVHWNSCLMTNS